MGEISSEFHMAVLECLLEQMDMKEKPIDEALREFQILFRMPVRKWEREGGVREGERGRREREREGE